MATKEAGIKLTLSAQGFNKGLKNTEEEAKRSASKIGEAFKDSLNDGLKAGLESVRTTFSTIKSTITTLGGLTGAIGVGELMRTAVTTEAGFRKLAFAIRAGTGAAVDFRRIQQDVQQVAIKTGQVTEQLGAVISEVYAETGDADFATQSIETIATAATGAHEPVEQLGAIAGTLNEKFGVTNDQLKDSMALLIGLGNKGGISIGDMAERLGFVGAYAKEAGLEGEAGLSKIVGMLNVADNSGKNLKKNIGAVGGLIEELGTKQKRNKTLLSLGVDPSGVKGDVTDVIGTILKQTGGSRDKLAVAFGGDQLSFLVELGKTYSGAFKEAEGSVKEKTAAALDAYRSALREAGQSAITWDDIQREAASEMESTDKQFQVALEKLKQTFSRPEITAAINQLAQSLPGLADIVTKVVGFAVENPYLAAGGALGATMGNAVIGAAANSAFDAMIKAAFSRGGEAAAEKVAEGMAGAAAKSAGGGIAQAFSASLLGAGALALIGGAIAGYFIASALDSGERERDLEKERAADTGEAYREGGGGEGGAGAEGSQYYEWKRNPETGELEAVPVDAATHEAKMEARRAEEEALAQGLAGADEAAGFMTPESGSSEQGGFSGVFAKPKRGGGTGGAAGGGWTPEQARLLAEMLGNKELRVKITNPEALRDKPGPGAGPPLPGNVDRR